MNPIRVPDEAKRGRPHCGLVSMGPPPGVSDQDCGTVEMLIAPGSDVPGIGRGQYAYFRPTPAELASLAAGGFIEIAQYGNVVQPFGMAIWDAAPPADATDPLHAFDVAADRTELIGETLKKASE